MNCYFYIFLLIIQFYSHWLKSFQLLIYCISCHELLNCILLNGLVLFHASVAFNKQYSQNIVYVSLICWTAAAAATTTQNNNNTYLCVKETGQGLDSRNYGEYSLFLRPQIGCKLALNKCNFNESTILDFPCYK